MILVTILRIEYSVPFARLIMLGMHTAFPSNGCFNYELEFETLTFFFFQMLYNGSRLDGQGRDQLKLTMYPEWPYIRDTECLVSHQLHSEHLERTLGQISAKCWWILLKFGSSESSHRRQSCLHKVKSLHARLARVWWLSPSNGLISIDPY